MTTKFAASRLLTICSATIDAITSAACVFARSNEKSPAREDRRGERGSSGGLWAEARQCAPYGCFN
jgi:hypothetical protein